MDPAKVKKIRTDCGLRTADCPGVGQKQLEMVCTGLNRVYSAVATTTTTTR